jgi:hypothetical protein
VGEALADLHHYRVSGLVVASDVALPGLNAAGAGQRTPDVVIRAARVPDELPDATTSGATWQIAGKRFLMRIPDVARFLLTDGRRIDYAVEPEGDPADIPIFILGTAIGILLHQREQIVLHASAIRVGGKAILFCGQSGAGKSTLAAALSKHGYAVMTDDVCAITTAGGNAPLVHPDGRQLKLWAQAIAKLDLGPDQGERVRSRLEKFYVEPRDTFSDALPLGAIYVLREARPPHAPGIVTPNIVDASLLLRRNAYRPLLVKRMDQKAGYFHAATTIANASGIFYLTRPLDFAALPQVVGWLEQHWRDMGLMEQAA